MKDKRLLANSFKIVLAGASLFLALNFISAAWQPAPGLPGTGTFIAPLNTGGDQTMAGQLRVFGLTAQNRIVTPTANVPGFLANDVLAWIGGVARATDFCLNSDPTLCLSNKLNRIIFSGKVSLAPSAITAVSCGPMSGECSTTAVYPSEYPKFEIPFDMSITNLRAAVQPIPATPGSYGCAFIIYTGPCDSVGNSTAGWLATRLDCSMDTSAQVSCSNTVAKQVLTQGQCVTLRISSNKGSSDCKISTAVWSFEGDY